MARGAERGGLEKSCVGTLRIEVGSAGFVVEELHSNFQRASVRFVRLDVDDAARKATISRSSAGDAFGDAKLELDALTDAKRMLGFKADAAGGDVDGPGAVAIQARQVKP